MAAFAQQHAEGCTFALSNAADRVNLVTGISWVNEALYATSTSLYDGVAEDAVQVWYNETVDYDYENNTCEPGRTCGRYRQVMIFAYYECIIHVYS